MPIPFFELEKYQNICRSHFGGRYGRRKPLVQKAVLNLGLRLFMIFCSTLI
jgi:hypothetical protein